MFIDLILSGKTISIDIYKFESGESKLFILGYSGSGKSTLGSKLAKKYKTTYYDLDNIWNEFIPKGKTSPKPPKGKTDEDLDDIVHKRMKQIIVSPKYKIIEGVNIIQYPELKSFVMKQSCIILGTSALKSSYKTIKRDWKTNNNNLFKKVKSRFLINFIDVNRDLKQFKKFRINKNTVIKNYKLRGE